MKRDGWTFLTNHGHVLVCLAQDSEVLLRDVAARTGITERSVQQIVADLERAGIIIRIRVGRRNRYLVRREECFRHPLEEGVTVGEFLDLVDDGAARVRHRPGHRPRVPRRVSLTSVQPPRPVDALPVWDATAQRDGRPSSR